MRCGASKAGRDATAVWGGGVEGRGPGMGRTMLAGGRAASPGNGGGRDANLQRSSTLTCTPSSALGSAMAERQRFTSYSADPTAGAPGVNGSDRRHDRAAAAQDSRRGTATARYNDSNNRQCERAEQA